jgi:hypothetical protein
MRVSRHFVLCGVAAGLMATQAEAAGSPTILVTDKAAVPGCATPGRLTAYLKSRNTGLEKRFEAVATEYMRHGETLGVRWDWAFYQMIVETGSLKFKNGNGRGDVSPSQNNFAGIGATGKGEPGEKFSDISSGVLAHLQHLMLYAGKTTENPVAERTRKVQEWKIVHPWAQKLGRPVTFADLGGKWAAKDYKYGDTIKSVEEKFNEEFCGKPDPNPEMVAEARRGRKTTVAAAPVQPGADIAKKSIEQARTDGSARSGLGAKALVAQPVAPEQPAANTTGINLLNAQPNQTATANARTTPPAMQAAATAPLTKAAPAAGKCRVWTASYGGAKSVIIKATAEGHVNYTVLDVNDGSEKRETDAYIAAYAKGGMLVGEFGSQAVALDKAFDLCPEG